MISCCRCVISKTTNKLYPLCDPHDSFCNCYILKSVECKCKDNCTVCLCDLLRLKECKFVGGVCLCLFIIIPGCCPYVYCYDCYDYNMCYPACCRKYSEYKRHSSSDQQPPLQYMSNNTTSLPSTNYTNANYMTNNTSIKEPPPYIIESEN